MSATLPPGCPVVPTGLGRHTITLRTDVAGEFTLPRSSLNLQATIDQIFGGEISWLWAFYGKTGAGGALRIAYEDFRRDLIQAAPRLMA